jgi:hypothetical protein
VLGRLRVVLDPERQRTLHEDGAVPNVAPVQRQRLARAQAGVGEDGEQRGVALPAAGAHRLDRRGRERLDLPAPRQPRSPHVPRGVGPDALRLDGALQMVPSSVRALGHCHRPAAGRQSPACQRAMSSGRKSRSATSPR